METVKYVSLSRIKSTLRFNHSRRSDTKSAVAPMWKRRVCYVLHCSCRARTVLWRSGYLKGLPREAHLRVDAELVSRSTRHGSTAIIQSCAVRSAIEKATYGYQFEADAPVTNFWQAYREMAREHAPELQIKEFSSKPSGAGFI